MAASPYPATDSRLPRADRKRLRVVVAFLVWVMTGDLENRYERRL
jgi:hypothetical protein